MAPKVVVATAQSMRLSLVASVRLFKALIADPVLLANGQFTWSFNYRQEFGKVVQAVLATDAVLAQRWNARVARGGAAPDTVFNQLSRASTSPVVRRDKFDDLVQAALRLSTGSTAATTLKRLLTASGADGARAHQSAMASLRGGTPVSQGSAAFQKAFPQSSMSFNGMYDIGKLSQDRCFEMTNAVCDFIAKKGGLHGRSGKAVDPDRVFVSEKVATPPATVPSVRRNVDPALGDLLRFSTHLSTAITIARKMLDHGHLINAGVVSGVNADNRVESPDHFLPVLAWEEFSTPIPHVVFAFWDPDASQSNDPQLGAAFGRLFFLKGVDAQNETRTGPNSGTVLANFFQNGRLSTALKDTGLRVGPDGDDANGQHRYQVTLMFAR